MENSCPASTSVVLTEPPELSNLSTIKQPGCNNADGSITLTTSGGTTPYTYTWLPEISNTYYADNLASGNYSVIIKDFNQCSDTVNINLLDAGSLTAATNIIKEVSCFGANDGEASVTVNGGVAPYIYSWSPYGGNSAVATNLAAGNYTTAVTDSKGCKVTSDVLITEPAILSTKISFQNTSCGNKDGSALVEVTGGTSPYQYAWNPGNLADASIIDLDSGEYIVTITDQNGCMQNDTAVIASSTAVKLQLSHNDIDCFGNTNGNASVDVSGGTLPYIINWVNGSQTFTGNSINNLDAGVYSVTVHDADVCSAVDSITIIQPQPFNLTVTAQPSVCNQNNGSASVIVTGATAPYTYFWSTISGTTATIQNLSAGYYPLTITDKNNCVISTGAHIENNNTLQISLGNDTTICNGDKIILSPGNFSSYTWQDNAETPTYTVTQQGTYIVTVTNNIGCMATDTIKIIADCGEIFFPSAFTPNGDMRNDLFGPMGNLNAITDYHFTVYNRYGQLIFQSRDAFKKWDGKIDSKNQQTETFVWYASYIYKALSYTRKGTVTLLR